MRCESSCGQPSRPHYLSCPSVRLSVPCGLLTQKLKSAETPKLVRTFPREGVKDFQIFQLKSAGGRPHNLSALVRRSLLVISRLLAVDKARGVRPLCGCWARSFSQEFSREVSQMFRQRQDAGKTTSYSYLPTYLLTCWCMSTSLWNYARWIITWKGSQRLQTSTNALWIFPLCSPGGSTIVGLA